MWKTLAGRCIYQSPDDSKVYQNAFYRWLTLGSDALQTLINRRHPQRPGLSYIKPMMLAVENQPGDSCLLGLGGAGVAHALSAIPGTSQIVAVESNQDVINTAKEYFMIDQVKNMSVIHQDANLFVQQSSTHYQHVLVDLFDAYSFPTHCNNYNFFYHCRRLLSPGGVLAINLANSHEQKPILHFLHGVFNRCTITIPVKGTANIVILAYNADSITPLLNKLQQNTPLKKLTWDATWGCIARI